MYIIETIQGQRKSYCPYVRQPNFLSEISLPQKLLLPMFCFFWKKSVHVDIHTKKNKNAIKPINSSLHTESKKVYVQVLTLLLT